MVSNAYKQGYQKGYNDAMTGKGKSNKKKGKDILILDFDNYSKNYTLGYNDGYRVGMRDSTK